jgi:hypothetical protein
MLEDDAFSSMGLAALSIDKGDGGGDTSKLSIAMDSDRGLFLDSIFVDALERQLKQMKDSQ